MDGYKRRKEQKKDAIRRAAEKLFAKHGTDKVSVAEIASAAGVSPVTIYNHYESKEGLIVSIAKQSVYEILAYYQKLNEEKLAFPQKIDKIFELKKNAVASDGITWILASSATVPEVRQVLNDYFEKDLKDEMIKLVADGKSQGFINPQLSDAAVLIYIEIFTSYYLNNIKATESIIANDSLMSEMYSMFWWGLDGKKWESEDK
ncbi:MAG TPA: TetR/AcrR family transcriptional regulator [Caldisericia bacterium]|nr:TetR/AcrR family transcriptional regulator [Caldisericia bacterium]HPF48713.1 TetR/AcrR family transcriptional regulator [Caldisericia bacterium]HPI83627.1 TetR/AcrR family transcriptional regulator [Caldisericia bacterium]HPQ93168.1 TetR/AcrR family transcriptional regulator [Caldisericia bacterium]HRV74999.1 TetR/AcrR family transcriptional regulator [Caldisericia bacterium]